MNLKRRLSPQQSQENISRKQFEEFLERHEWITTDISPDLGEDILVRIYENGVTTGLSFYVQLKSTVDIQKHILKSGNISFQFDVKDLEHWEAQVFTVIMCVWDINKKQGWWISIYDAVQYLEDKNDTWKKKEKVNVHISKDAKIDEHGLKNIRHLLANKSFPVISQNKELTIKTKFEFPQTKEGKAKFAEVQKHFLAGDEVEIGGEFITAFDVSDWWTRLYGDIDPKAMKLRMGPTRSLINYPAQIKFNSPQYTAVIIPYVEFRIIKQGEEEITLSNEHQEIPFHFTYIVNKTTRQQNIIFTSQLGDNNASDALLLLNIQNIVSVGGEIFIKMHNTGEHITLPIPAGSLDTPNPEVIKFLEKLNFIQDKLKVEFKFPKEVFFTKDDILNTEELISIIKTGSYRQTGLIFTIDLRKPGVEEIIKGNEDGSQKHIRLESGDSHVEIMSQQIELGPMVQQMKGDLEMRLDKIQEWLINAKEEDSLKVRLINVELHEEFENWPIR